MARWLAGPDALSQRVEGDFRVHPRRIVRQTRRPKGLPVAENRATEGLVNVHPHGWVRLLGRWVHLEKHRGEELDEARS